MGDCRGVLSFAFPHLFRECARVHRYPSWGLLSSGTGSSEETIGVSAFIVRLCTTFSLSHLPTFFIYKMATRAQVNVFGTDGKQSGTATMPFVFSSPIRPDVVNFVHTNVAKNRRQAYAVAVNAGHQHSAHSWGTGRAVSRIPRVSGGGTHRAGQGAFGNMCRGGRMFAPTKFYRKWHRRVPVGSRRYAVCSALAASALPALVTARGHRIRGAGEIPLVVDDACESINKTSQAYKVLQALGVSADVDKARDSRKVRAGKGKMRNKRFTQRRGPLVVYNNANGIQLGFRNLPGVELCHVDRLNLLTLAPGGHLGRLCVFTKSAFEKLDQIFGTASNTSESKTGFRPPQHIMSNSDLARLINSDEVQSVVRPAKRNDAKFVLKKNPLKNLGAMIKLNPYAIVLRRAELRKEEAAAKKSDAIKQQRLKVAAAKKARKVGSTKFYKSMARAEDRF